MSLAYIRLFIADFELDTSHLTIEEDGAYNRLLRLCWRTPGCSIPADDEWIRRRMRCDVETYERAVKPVLDEFFVQRAGRYEQKRLKREYEHATGISETQSEKGKKGGRAKSLKTQEASESYGQAAVKPEESTGKAPAKQRQSCGKATAKPGESHPDPDPDPDPDIRSPSVRPSVVTRAREAEPPPDRSPDGDLGRTDGGDFSDLSDRVLSAAGFDPARRNAKTDAWLRQWRAKLPPDRIVAAVEARTEAMRATGDPPRTLRAFDHELGVQAETSAGPKPFTFDRSLIR